MKVVIEQANGQAGWVVWLDRQAVRFRTQAEAQAYAERLCARLEAPHPPPAGCRALLCEPQRPRRRCRA